jgi:hypothetical protein
VTKPGETAAPKKSLGRITIRKNVKADFNYEMKENFRSETEDLQKKFEQQFLQVANKFHKQQKQRVIDQLQPKKIVASSFNPDEEAKALTDVSLPLFILLAQEQGKLAASFAGNAGTEFKLTPVMQTYIRESLLQATLGFSGDTPQLVAETISDGLRAGETVAKLTQRINDIYKAVLGVKQPGNRIERLVRTEVIKTSNEITEAAYKQSGVVSKKEWFANPGHCEFCAKLNGSVISLGGVYVPKGGQLEGEDGGTRINAYEDVKHPPVHPQCRCTLIPVLEENQ